MSTEVEKTRYGLMPLDEGAEGRFMDSFGDARDAAHRIAAKNNVAVAVVQMVGVAQPGEVPVTWSPRGYLGSKLGAEAEALVAPPRPGSVAAVAAASSPQLNPEAPASEQPAAPTPAAPVPDAQPEPAVEVTREQPAPHQPQELTPTAPPAESAALSINMPTAPRFGRKKPKHPAIRGVTFPEFADVIPGYPTGHPDGPMGAKQLAEAMSECTRLGAKLDQTVEQWTGLHLNDINWGTAECIIKILKAYQKS